MIPEKLPHNRPICIGDGGPEKSDWRKNKNKRTKSKKEIAATKKLKEQVKPIRFIFGQKGGEN
jgi:hypothetical protein